MKTERKYVLRRIFIGIPMAIIAELIGLRVLNFIIAFLGVVTGELG